MSIPQRAASAVGSRPRAVLALICLALASGIARADLAAPLAQPAADPRATLEAYREVLRRGATPGDAALFTPGSRLQQARRPASPEEQRARLAEIDGGAPLQLFTQGEYAAFLPAGSQAMTAVPVLMRRIDGLWRIDLVELRKNFSRKPQGGFTLWNGNDPYRFAWPQRYGYANDDLRDIDLYGEELEDVIRRLSAAPGLKSHLRLGQIYLRNAGLFEEAMSELERGARMAPNDWNVVRDYGEHAVAYGGAERAIPLVEPFGEKAQGLLEKLLLKVGRRDEAKKIQMESLKRLAEGWQEKRRQEAIERLRKEGNVLPPEPAAPSSL